MVIFSPKQRAIAGRIEADVHAGEENVEMTDFATRPEYRGRGLSGYLLCRMEAAVRSAGIRTAFTIARATSLPINHVFARAGYAYGGTLVNNTGICGGLESMHVRHRLLPDL